MSGGHFDYRQYHIEDIGYSIERLIKRLDHEEYSWLEISEKTKGVLIDAVKHIKKSAILANRIDWFLSGDDGEDSFHKRLSIELENLEKTHKDTFADELAGKKVG